MTENTMGNVAGVLETLPRSMGLEKGEILRL